MKFRKLNEGDYISAKEWNALVDMINGIFRSTMPDGVLDSSGFHPRRRLQSAVVQAVYRTASNSVNGGEYNCLVQVWEDAEYVQEVGTPADSDYVLCKIITEDAGHSYSTGTLLLQVGQADSNGVVPVVPASDNPIRIAYCSDNASSGTSILCNLGSTNGEQITVVCEIYEDGTNLNSCVPLLQEGDEMKVIKDGSTWRSLTTFIPTENC